MIKAVIFDVDGVLIDDTRHIIDIYRETARQVGIRPPSRQKVLAALGRTGFEMIDRILGKKPIYKKVYYKIWDQREHRLHLTLNAKAILKKIKCKKAVVTSRGNKKLKKSLKNIYRDFDVIIGRNDVKKHKPDPAPILAACRQLKINPKEAAYVGDAAVDVKAARRAKTIFIGMLSGGTTRKQFKKMKVRYIIKSLGELPALIKTL